MTTILEAALEGPPLKLTCEAKTGVRPGPFGFEPLWCHQHVGLRSFTDGRGETRWYCVAPGHRQSVVHRFGRAVATDDDYQPESADGLTAAKIRAEVDELYGTSCNEPGHVDGCAGRVGGDHEWDTRKARYDAMQLADTP